MAAIRPCTGTTADWKAVEDTLILKEREVGVEIDTSGHYLVRQGDGKNKFFDLPIIVNNARYEEILELTQEQCKGRRCTRVQQEPCRNLQGDCIRIESPCGSRNRKVNPCGDEKR